MQHPKCDLCERTMFAVREVGEGQACLACLPQNPGEFRTQLDKRGLFSHMVWEKGFDATITFLNKNGSKLTATNIDQVEKMWWKVTDEKGNEVFYGAYTSPEFDGSLAYQARMAGHVKKIQF